METFELLLRIKESVGEETFRDAVELLPQPHPTATPPPAPGPEGLVRVEPINRRTKLPNNFICAKGHKHPVTKMADLLRDDVPKCLMKRIIVEYLCFDEVDDA